ATLLYPGDDPDPVPLAPPAAGVTPEPRYTDRSPATAWFDERRPVLQTVLHHAIGAGFAAHAWHLAWSLDAYLAHGGHRPDRVDIWQVALRAAERLDDPDARTMARRRLADASVRLDRTDEVLARNERALVPHLRRGGTLRAALDGEVSSPASPGRDRAQPTG